MSDLTPAPAPRHKDVKPSVKPFRQRIAGGFMMTQISVALFTGAPETAEAAVTTAVVVTQVASDVGTAEDVLTVENESVPGGVPRIRGDDPWEPVREPLEQWVDVEVDEWQERQENLKREVEAEIVQEAKDRQLGAEISGPAPPDDPYWRANVARSERLGEAIDAKWGPEGRLHEAEQQMARAQDAEQRVDRDPRATDAERQAARLGTAAAQAELVSVQTEVDMAPVNRLERANARLESADAAERAVVRDQRSTESERFAARFATVDAQVDRLNAQSAWDAADLNHRAVLHEGDLAAEWARDHNLPSAPDVFHEQAVRDLIQQESAHATDADLLRPVVIGEDQRRVDYAAQRFDAETYPGLSAAEAGYYPGAREGTVEVAVTPEAKAQEPPAAAPDPNAQQKAAARARALQEELARARAAAKEAADKAAKEAAEKAAKEAAAKAAADKAAKEAAAKAAVDKAKEQQATQQASANRNGRGANQREATQRDAQQRKPSGGQAEQPAKEAKAPAPKQK